MLPVKGDEADWNQVDLQCPQQERPKHSSHSESLGSGRASGKRCVNVLCLTDGAMFPLQSKGGLLERVASAADLIITVCECF